MKAPFILSSLFFLPVLCYCHANNKATKQFGGGITLGITTKNPSCTNAIGYDGNLISNGAIIIVASGGSPPYTYDIHQTPPQANGYFPGLSAGVYNAVIKDAAGETADTTITLVNTLPQPANVAPSFNILPSCVDSNGSFGIKEIGGTPPYTYSIDGGVTFTPKDTFTNMTQGAYLYYIKDANGCLSIGSNDDFIYAGAFFCYRCCTLFMAVGGGYPSCTNQGTSLVYASGGTPPYQYSLDSINFITVNYTPNYYENPYEYEFKNLAAGLYHVYARDSVGNTAVSAFVVSKSCNVAITYVGVNASCQKNDGSIIVNASFGTPPYSYTIDGVNFQPGNTFTGLSAGSYSVTVNDADGETYSIEATLYNKCPVVSATETDETCSQKNGVITASGTNGTRPYQFSVDGANFQSDSVFTGLGSGNYTVTLKDANGFTDSTTITINNNCLKVTAATTDDACGQNIGSITATGSGGTPPYAYSINGVNFQSGAVFTGLDSGSYTLTIKDAALLTSTLIVYISNRPAPVIHLGNDTTLCAGQTLTLAVNITGSDITYTWKDGSTGNSFTVTQAGKYWVNVNDSGCVAGDTITVTYLSLSNNIFPTRDTTLCKGSQLVLNAGNAGATYFWDNNSNGQTRTVDSSGTYWVRVSTDGCTASDTITCNFVTGPVITLPGDTAFCAGQQLVLRAGSNIAAYVWGNNSTADSLIVTQGGSYTLAGTANGCTTYDTVQVTQNPVPSAFIGNDTVLCAGQTLQLIAPLNAQYQYLWQNNTTGNTYTATAAGSYWLKVTNQYNCFTMDTVNIRFRPLPVFSLGDDTSLCSGQVLNLQVSVPQATYLWSTGSTLPGLTINAAGSYWVNVSDSGCAKSDTITVSFKPLPVIALGNDTTLCTGQTLVLNAANNNATYLWQDGSAQATYTVTTEGVYSVTATLGGCDTTGKITVNYITKPVINIGGDTTLCTRDQLILNAAYPQTNYLWQDGSTQPIFTVTQAGVYSVQATNACGTVTDSLSVQYESCACKFYMPTAFTPNGDGINDIFKPTYKCFFSQYQLRIFNRFGQNIYSSQDAGTGWDGTLNGFPEPPGTYVWEIAYFDTLTGKLVKKNGTLVLVR